MSEYFTREIAPSRSRRYRRHRTILNKEVEKIEKKKESTMPVSEPYCFYLTAWEEEQFNIAQANAPV